MAAPTIGSNWQAALRLLRKGWGSDGGQPITDAAIEGVERLHVVPCSDGGIQIESHADGWDIEICFGPDGRINGWIAARD